MKVALTGYTRGVGRALNQAMLDRNWTVKGYSRTNGYDLAVPINHKKIVNDSADCDIFINNAHYGYAQTEILYHWYDQYKNSDKIHVVVGSHAADFVHTFSHRYEIHKRSIDDACRNLWLISQADGPKSKIILAKIGLTDTDMVRNMPNFQDRTKMTADYVAEKILWTIDQSFIPGGYIREISISPCISQN